MELEYDEAKRLEVLDERQLDFRDARVVFAGFHLTRADDRENYGEKRFITLGECNNIVVKVVWTKRNDKRRIITMWKARHGEREGYYRHRDASG